MNNKITSNRRLVLHRETIRRLTSAQLRSVAGGRWNESIVTQCDCPTLTCGDPIPVSRVNTACTGTDIPTGSDC